jgi:excisionase family DNA binding protein
MAERTSIQRLLDVREVAELIHVPVRAVYLLAEEGRIESIKIGQRLRFAPEAIERFLQANARPVSA